MVLEADRLGCADEVIVIAAALSIQDPRERPAEQARAGRPAARALRRRARRTSSRYLNLWRYLREQQRALSGNQFRKRCQAEFLHYLRVREWQDLVAQLRQAAKGVGVTLNQRAGRAGATIHVALLAGLLSHVGHAATPARREYLGARGARFALWPGLGARAQAAELGDGRRARRDLAAVGPDRGADRPALDRAARRAPRQAHATPSRTGSASAARSSRPSA